MATFILPIKGISKLFTYDKSAPGTSGDMNNVRAIGIFAKQIRICQRPGLDKWGNGDQIGGTDIPVVAMCTVSTMA